MNRIADGRRLHNLEPMKMRAMQRSASRSLQKIFHDAETSASSSNNERLNAARAGIERGGNTAPGSQMPLSANGLLAGTRDEASAWLQELKNPENPERLERDYTLFKIARAKSRKPEDFEALNAEDKTKAMSLSQKYAELYHKPAEMSSSSRPGHSSQAGSSKKEHPTTADSRRLPASTIARQEYIKQFTEDWNRMYNPEAASKSDELF